MKSKYIITSVAALALFAVTAASAFAGEEKEETISMDKVPKAVLDALPKYASTSEVKSVEKGNQDGKTVYEFTIEKAGRKYELALSPKGKYKGTEEDVEFSSMPEAVQSAFKTLAAGGKISGGEKAEDAHHKVTYEADIEKDGKKSEIAVDANGKVITHDNEEKEGKEGKRKGRERNEEGKRNNLHVPDIPVIASRENVPPSAATRWRPYFFKNPLTLPLLEGVNNSVSMRNYILHRRVLADHRLVRQGLSASTTKKASSRPPPWMTPPATASTTKPKSKRRVPAIGDSIGKEAMRRRGAGSAQGGIRR